jgi:hypothetical protein
MRLPRLRGHGVATAAILGLLTGCGTAQPDDLPAGTGDPATAAVDDPVEDGNDTAATGATEAFTAIAAAMEAGDLDALVMDSVGPAAAFFTWMRHLRAASGEAADPFENLVVEPPVPQVTDEGDVARVDATIGYGSQEGAPPRILTNLELRLVDGAWRLAGFERNGVPIAEWVAPAPAEASVTAAGIDVEVIGVFVDRGCLDGSDPNCPEAIRDSAGVAFVVINRTGGDIEPVPVALDGGEAVAVLEAGGSAFPLVDAAVQGFPRDLPSPVVGVFQGASSLGEGGVVRLAWEAEAGAVHTFELPVPVYPHDWASDGW